MIAAARTKPTRALHCEASDSSKRSRAFPVRSGAISIPYTPSALFIQLPASTAAGAYLSTIGTFSPRLYVVECGARLR